MSSFRFPQQLLHSVTEPQWIPRPKEETSARFDELTRQQKLYIERTRKQVIPPAPEAIGVSLADETKSKKKPDPPPEVDVMALPSRPVFWDHYRSQVDFARFHTTGQEV